MMQWLGTGFMGLTRGWWLAIAAAVALAAWLTIDTFFDRVFETTREAGALEAENAGHETTLDQLGKANDAGNEVRNGSSSAAYDQCVQDVAPGYESSCERYRPIFLVPDRP